ncbi:MAG: amidohydrolase family protein [Pyrinomonadaceae bacterium]
MITRYALDERLPLMIHAAESKSEEALMQCGSGPFAEGDCGSETSLEYARVSSYTIFARSGSARRKASLAHCINVDDPDIETIKSAGAKVAHCPESNAPTTTRQCAVFFIRQSSVARSLAATSVASNNTCDMLEEARFALLLSRLKSFTGDSISEPFVSTDEALQAATLGGARTLGLEETVGTLQPGYAADLAVISSFMRTHQMPVYDVAGALVFSSSARDVLLTVVAGREVYSNGRVNTVDEDRLRARILEIGEKLSRTR